jgi:hypothetical protein
VSIESFCLTAAGVLLATGRSASGSSQTSLVFWPESHWAASWKELDRKITFRLIALGIAKHGTAAVLASQILV